MAARSYEICIDAMDPGRLRPFWRTALGYVDQQTAEGSTDLVDPAGRLPTIWFQKVPEPKVGKNRVHLDIRAEPGQHEGGLKVHRGFDDQPPGRAANSASTPLKLPRCFESILNSTSVAASEVSDNHHAPDMDPYRVGTLKVPGNSRTIESR